MPRAELAWLLAVSTLAAGLSSVVESQADGYRALSRALLGGCFGLTLPFASLYLVAMLQLRSVTPTLEQLARFGADRRLLFIGTHGVMIGSSAVLGAWLATCTALVSRASVAETLSCTAIGTLAGLSYGAWFGWASSFNKPRRARLIALAADWAMGLSAGAGAWLEPRSHVRKLVVAERLADLNLLLNAAALLVLTACYLGLTWRRVPR
jgi:hypothetical protein